MRDYRSLVVSFVEIVVFLLTSFGGFLKDVAPPIQVGAQYAVGISSFLTLIALMIIAALGRSSRRTALVRKRWILAGACAFLVALPPSILFYPQALHESVWYPDGYTEPHIRGSDTGFTKEVREFLTIAGNEDKTGPKELLNEFPLDNIWTKESIAQAEMRLLVYYCWLVIALATAVFCLLEANVGNTRIARSEPKEPLVQ